MSNGVFLWGENNLIPSKYVEITQFKNLKKQNLISHITPYLRSPPHPFSKGLSEASLDNSSWPDFF